MKAWMPIESSQIARHDLGFSLVSCNSLQVKRANGDDDFASTQTLSAYRPSIFARGPNRAFHQPFGTHIKALVITA